MVDQLKQEFEYYLEHQAQLVRSHDGKVIVIKNNTVIGVYDSEFQALKETAKNHELGTFLIQKCAPGKESYTQTFHRIAFA